VLQTGWQHPFITIDQNQPRHPELMARLLDDCRRNDLRLLLPDGAFLEFSKGCPFETARRSLQPLASCFELVCSSRKIAELMRAEAQGRAPCTTLVHDDATEFLQSMLAQMERGMQRCCVSLSTVPSLRS